MKKNRFSDSGNILLPNQTLGRYELLEELGCGGMASVYRARDPGLDREVALKVMHPILAYKEEGLKRFRREAKAVARLKHNNIVEVYDYSDGSDTGGTPYLVCELINGPNLGEFLEINGPPLPEITAIIGACIAEALGKAHKTGIIHRDIKPENILVDSDGRLVLTDFGIARLQGDETMTATGAVMGSPAFMSPEQAQGGVLGPSSDIFSLGVVLYRVVTGRLPFSGANALSTVSAILQGKFSPPLQVRHDLGPEMDRIINRCLSVRPEDRYGSMEELAEELREMASQGGIKDQDEELGEYLRHPGNHLERLEKTVLAATMERARKADIPALALAFCDRVLAADPDNAEAKKLLDELSAWKKWKMAALFFVGAALIGTVAFLAVTVFLESAPRSTSEPRDVLSKDSLPDATAKSDESAFFENEISSEPGGKRVDEDPDAKEAERLQMEGNDGRGFSGAPTNGKEILAGPEKAPRRKDIRGRTEKDRVQKTKDETSASKTLPDDELKSNGEKKDEQGSTKEQPSKDEPRGTPDYGFLTLGITPWCNARVDGRPVGRSPDPKRKIKLPVGSYTVECSQDEKGPMFSRTIEIQPGRTRNVRGYLPGWVNVSISLSRGDRVSIGGRTYSRGSNRIKPGRHRVILYQGEVPKDTAWINFVPGGDCNLVDKPKLNCQ